MFDYVLLNGSAAKVREAAEAIRRSSRSIADEAIYIGQKLTEVKAMLPHGTFAAWLQQEFGWTVRTAQNYMSVAEKFGKCETVSYLSLSVMIELSGKDVPEAAIDEVRAIASTGQKVTRADAAQVKKKHAPVNRIAKNLQEVYKAPVEEPKPELHIDKPIVVAPIPAPVVQQAVAPAVQPLPVMSDSQKIAKIMELVASLESPDSQYEVVTRTVAMLHPEDRLELFDRLNTAYKQTESKQGELFAGDPADLVPPKKINTPEVRKAWSRWCDSNKAKGKPLTIEEANSQLRLLATGKAETAVQRIEYALATRAETIPLARELPKDFEEPTEEAVLGYAKPVGVPESVARDFFQHYAAQGWVLGNGRPMTDWKQSLHAWNRHQATRGLSPKRSVFDEPDTPNPLTVDNGPRKPRIQLRGELTDEQKARIAVLEEREAQRELRIKAAKGVK